MDLSGQRVSEAPRGRAWTALSSPETLSAGAVVKLKPIAARFTGKVMLSDLGPANGYTISGKGQGETPGLPCGQKSLKPHQQQRFIP